MLKIITTLTLFLFGILAKGQEVENRVVSEFSKVEVKNGMELIYNESNLPSLQIEAKNHNLLNNVITEVEGKTLKIYLDRKNLLNPANKTIKVYLSGKNLTSFVAYSKAKITVLNTITAKNLNVILNSESQFYGTIITEGKTKLIANTGTIFNGRVETNTFVGNFRNNAKVNLSGSALSALIQNTDSTLLNAKNFIANEINLNATGKSLAMIYVDKTMAITVADEARVSYTGFPEKINLNEEAESIKKNSSTKLISFNY